MVRLMGSAVKTGFKSSPAEPICMPTAHMRAHGSAHAAARLRLVASLGVVSGGVGGGGGGQGWHLLSRSGGACFRDGGAAVSETAVAP